MQRKGWFRAWRSGGHGKRVSCRGLKERESLGMVAGWKKGGKTLIIIFAWRGNLVCARSPGDQGATRPDPA
nr:hypothetical protein Iba_scaffold156.2CG0160 [Ipomoea batatas]